MSEWIKQLPAAAREYLRDDKLEEVECIIADFPGIARGKAVPVSVFARQKHFHLPESIFYQTITGNWCAKAAVKGFVEPDMVLRPDLSAAVAAPWAADRTLQVVHDAVDGQGRPIATTPRNMLKSVVDAYGRRGLQPIVAPEMEFYLVAPNTDPAVPVEPMMGRSGRPAAARQVYSMSAVDEYGPVIDDIYDFAEAQGFEIDGITQEDGAGQVEINLRHGDPVHLADEVFFFKRLIREAALRHNCYATFMAKPIAGQPGSAMHIHHSLRNASSNHNIFTHADGTLSDEFRHFLGGLQQRLPAAIAVLAPYVNSYRRYVRNHAAPINLSWARDNRTVGLRVPLSTPDARRIENRIAGMDCNPYLGIAASLACGLIGLENKLEPSPETEGEAYHGAEEIPRDLGHALDLFDAATDLHEVLGGQFARVYSAVKRAEYEEFLQVISPWERENLLTAV